MWIWISDVGTNNASLIQDPFYPGLKRPRERNEEYFALIEVRAL